MLRRAIFRARKGRTWIFRREKPPWRACFLPRGAARASAAGSCWQSLTASRFSSVPWTRCRTGHFLAECLRRGFLAVRNDAPEEGVSRSIRLGLRAAEPCSAVLFLVGDQPLLTAGSVRRILAAGRENPDKIIVPQRPDGQSGNPCLFPAAFFPELLSLEGDRGGRRVIRAHPEAVFPVSVPEEELADTDTKEELRRLAKA